MTSLTNGARVIDRLSRPDETRVCAQTMADDSSASASELSSDEEVSSTRLLCRVCLSVCLSVARACPRLQLQEGLASGTLTPGLIGRVPAPKTYTNNVVSFRTFCELVRPYAVSAARSLQSGLREALAGLKRKGQSEWLERMDITCRAVPQTTEQVEKEGEAEEKELDPNDDFRREMWL